MIAALILAAGESRRMGRPKALIPYHGLTFVEHLLAATRLPRIGETRVVLGAGAAELRGRLPVRESQIVVNEDWEAGPLFSFWAGLRSLPDSDVEGGFVSPLD